jgi:hypothetical protein
LRLPRSNTKVTEITVDSSVFFSKSPFKKFPLLDLEIQRALSCTAKLSEKLQILHWVTVHKSENVPEEEVLRQTIMAMVPGLYQRKALNRMDDFVFGSAHSDTSLRVLAGTWVLKPARPSTLDSGDTQPELGDKRRRTVDSATASDKGKAAEGKKPSSKRRKITRSTSIKVTQEKTTADQYEASLTFSTLLSLLTSWS